MNAPSVNYRLADQADLIGINAVIERAVMSWDLPERVKRLSLPSYLYQAHDLDHLELWVAEVPRVGIVGVATWEPAASGDAPEGMRALLLHGLYIAPDSQRGGIGTRLLAIAEMEAARQGYDGLLVKAQPSAAGFFIKSGLKQVPVNNPAKDYPYRFWHPAPKQSGAHPK